jgi:hypothetical protein
MIFKMNDLGGFMKFSILLLALTFSIGAFAATDYNSSRSNRSTSIISDTQNDLEEASKSLEYLGDEIDVELVHKLQKVEQKTAHLKERMLVDTFVKTFFLNIKELGCRDFSDEKCVSAAIIGAEEKAYKMSTPRLRSIVKEDGKK